MEFLQERLRDLKKQLCRAADLESATALSTDIRNIEKALQIDGELRAVVNGPKTPIRVSAVVGESDQEFRARAKRELAAVREV